MASILSNQNIASWRSSNQDRPWYAKALSLLSRQPLSQAIDLGAGAGELATLLKSQIDKITCVDYAKGYVQALRKQGFTAVQADLNQPLQFPSHQFDLVTSLEVIEHLVNHELFLEEINRLLKPKGYLLISTPNIAWWGYRLEAFLGRPPKKEGYHLRFFTYNTLTELLEQSGFKIINSASHTTIPFINRLLIKLKLKPVHPVVSFRPNLLAQDLVFLCQKK